MDNRLAPGQFHGQLRHRREIEGLVLTEYTYPAGIRIPEHSHKCAYFCLILKGAYTESYAARSRECEPMTVLFHPEGELHSNAFRSEGRIFSIEVQNVYLARIRTCIDAL